MRKIMQSGSPIAIGFVLIGVSFPASASVPATVEGGPDSLGQSYQWTVSNQASSPIVHVEFPHYRASLFFAPAKWTFSCSNQVAVGSIDAPGVCVAKADSPGDGVAPGRSAVFGMQLASGAVKRGMGEVRLTFADSTSYLANQVAVPVPETFGDKYIPLIGLGVILAAFVAIRSVQGRKRHPN